MKDPSARTKVVVRRLPPGMAEAGLMEQIDVRFAGRYKWACFRPGKNSHKSLRYSRAYIAFNTPQDVVEFAEFFNGHVFVNEKGTQFKALVEYAPSQHIPKPWPKKDGREGTITKDPEYLEFLQNLAKPVENLPSAEIQLEKKEAERAGAAKEAPIVTPLMDFVRAKRAAKSVSQRSVANGKTSRRAGAITVSNSISASTKRSSERRKAPTSMYVLRDSVKNANRKEKSRITIVSRKEEQKLLDKSSAKALDDDIGSTANVTVAGVSGASDSGKNRIVLLKAKEREIPLVVTSGGGTSSALNHKQASRHDASGKMIRGILTKEVNHPDQQHPEREKRPPRPPVTRLVTKDRVSSVSDGDKRSVDDKGFANDSHLSAHNEKQDRRTRNKDRPDRGVWARRRSDGSHASDEFSSSSQNVQFLPESTANCYISQQGATKIDDDMVSQNARTIRGCSSVTSRTVLQNHVEVKGDLVGSTRSGECRTVGVAHGGLSSVENGSHRHGGRRGLLHGIKEVDSFNNPSEGKQSKKAGPGYGSHEKQVWVQKTASG